MLASRLTGLVNRSAGEGRARHQPVGASADEQRSRASGPCRNLVGRQRHTPSTGLRRPRGPLRAGLGTGAQLFVLASPCSRSARRTAGLRRAECRIARAGASGPGVVRHRAGSLFRLPACRPGAQRGLRDRADAGSQGGEDRDTPVVEVANAAATQLRRSSAALARHCAPRRPPGGDRSSPDGRRGHRRAPANNCR